MNMIISATRSRRGLFERLLAVSTPHQPPRQGLVVARHYHRQPGRCSGGNRTGLIAFITGTLACARTTTARGSLYSETAQVLCGARQRPRRVCAITWVIMWWVVAANMQHIVKRDDFLSCKIFRLLSDLDDRDLKNTSRSPAAPEESMRNHVGDYGLGGCSKYSTRC